jgi:hypothetical protein
VLLLLPFRPPLAARIASHDALFCHGVPYVHVNPCASEKVQQRSSGMRTEVGVVSRAAGWSVFFFLPYLTSPSPLLSSLSSLSSLQIQKLLQIQVLSRVRLQSASKKAPRVSFQSIHSHTVVRVIHARSNFQPHTHPESEREEEEEGSTHKVLEMPPSCLHVHPRRRLALVSVHLSRYWLTQRGRGEDPPDPPDPPDPYISFFSQSSGNATQSPPRAQERRLALVSIGFSRY